MDTARDIQRDALPIKCIEGAILGLFFTCGQVRPGSMGLGICPSSSPFSQPLYAATSSSAHTPPQEDLDRMALRFKTTAGGNVYRHIVLAMRHRPSGKWGAIGLSRRQELMYKPMGYASLADLVTDYKVSLLATPHQLRSRRSAKLPTACFIHVLKTEPSCAQESYEQWFHKVLKVRVGLPAEHNLYYSGRINWCYTVLKVPRPAPMFPGSCTRSWKCGRCTPGHGTPNRVTPLTGQR